MKVLKLKQNSPEWFEARKGKITGSKLKDIVVKRGTKDKVGFYQLIADRLSVDEAEGSFADEMEKAHEREDEAAKLYEENFGVKLKKVGMWVSDKNDRIAISPDRAVIKDPTKGIEIKCFGAARHLQAYIENELPANLKDQNLQYYIVNPKLKTVETIFYNPQIPSLPLFTLITKRKDLEEEIKTTEEYQLDVLRRVDEWVERLSF